MKKRLIKKIEKKKKVYEEFMKNKKDFERIVNSSKVMCNTLKKLSINIVIFSKNFKRIIINNIRKYPCKNCGVLRSKNEGGEIFTVWDKVI